MPQRNDIDWEEVWFYLLEGGLTLDEYIELKRKDGKPLSFSSHQRLHQLCLKELKISSLNFVRTPAWYAIRMGLELFAERANLKRAIDDYGSVNQIAIAYGIKVHRLRMLAKRHRIVIEQVRGQWMVVICADCNKELRRRACRYDPKKRYFCNRKCHGRWLGKRFGLGKHGCIRRPNPPL